MRQPACSLPPSPSPSLSHGPQLMQSALTLLYPHSLSPPPLPLQTGRIRTSRLRRAGCFSPVPHRNPRGGCPTSMTWAWACSLSACLGGTAHGATRRTSRCLRQTPPPVSTLLSLANMQLVHVLFACLFFRVYWVRLICGCVLYF